MPESPATGKRTAVSICDLANDQRFAPLGSPRRIWAISAIHADVERLTQIHHRLYPQLQAGDRIIYLGNIVGHGARAVQTVDEILTFRRAVLSMPGWVAPDIAYLRGAQEEMWDKLTQLQFAPNPREVLPWMLERGVAATLESYGMNPTHGLIAARDGVMSLTKWTAGIRAATRRHAGHATFLSQFRRAAFTTSTPSGYPLNSAENDNGLLFIHAGLNPNCALEDQGDCLWWGGRAFHTIHAPYAPFRKVVRGFDPNRAGIRITSNTATIDGGCGFGGTLVCAGFSPQGEIFSLIETTA